ncbi:ATP-binding protein [Arthrobacter sp. SLBN-53]|uniref:HAMP domain-containing sensor histidine kinase n=1 Tax=Arthrobacter sp. SLBN-53 TaxID=2768412 RepID=UPI00116BFA52|nr:ATP-binding protein [Arthrobacter sp. SLBN-53]TQK30923.1 signal transduction histidine kinase [Arthrobacter sp. SLBN-53]
MTVSPASSADGEIAGAATTHAKRPARWSLSNWPATGKIVAIIAVPMLLAAALGGVHVYKSFTEDGISDAAATRDAVIVAVLLLVALLIVALVARSLVGPLRRLRDSALQVAHTDLARELEQVRAGGDPGPLVPIPVHTTEELGQLAHAVDELHEQALQLAGEQARLQVQVSDMFETVSRRSRSLVDQQLTLIDQLERDEQDPGRLEGLFRLDHLAARMRRNGANLLVLAGTDTARGHSDPVPLSAVVNAASSEVEDYPRLQAAALPDCAVVGSVATDLVHVLAELMDNGLRYSPPATTVRISGLRTDDGALVLEIGDDGLGMAEPDLRVTNTRLQSDGEVTAYTTRHMGLFVVARLAARHGLVVRLRATVGGDPNSGTTAGIYLPAELVVGEPGLPRTADVERVPAEVPVAAAAVVESVEPVLPRRDPSFAAATPNAGSDDAIYQKMLSEWLVDPTDLGVDTNLDWKSVWDNGWSAAQAAETTPATEHTAEGLPVRRPGARLVPGAGEAEPATTEPTDPVTAPLPDPSVIRASLNSHFAGVHAARSRPQDTGGDR